MSNNLVIPGVQVTVVKEVLPQQLAPSGVLGLVGFTEKSAGKVERVSSFSRMIDVLGRGTAYSLPEARQALDNGVSELVVSPLAPSAGTRATAAVLAPAPSGGGTASTAFTLVARAPGLWANSLEVTVEARQSGSASASFDLRIARPGEAGEEVYRNVNVTATSDRYVGKVLAESAIAELSGTGTPVDPAPQRVTFLGGTDAGAADYAAALQRLREEADVDMVLCAVQDPTAAVRSAVYSDVISHCNLMSGESKGRIGFGEIPPGANAAAAAQMAAGLVSDRFVLVAPSGVVGAVAGLTGNLPYFQSPTFKALTGLTAIRPINVDDQRALLSANVVPVVLERGRGVIVLRGLTTDGDQINVRRVADHAVRTLKSIGQLFIGLLNTADGRNALRQKLTEALLQMAKEGAIVPSTDGIDPPFKLDVYSSQADFALGIVRIDMAVRPVRAIDYIYATVTVQV